MATSVIPEGFKVVEPEIPEGFSIAPPEPTAREQQLQTETFGESIGRRASEVGQTALQGATLGFSDEIQSVIAAAIAAPFVSDKTFGQLMVDARKSVRDEVETFSKENPKTALGLQAAGGALTAAPVLKGLQTAKVPVTGARGVVASGGTIGGVAGTGVAEEGERLEGAGKGVVGGLLFGGVVSGVGGAAKAVALKLAPGVQNRLSQIAEASGLTPAQIRTRLKALGPKATIADVDDVFQRAGDVSASRLGPAAKRVRELIRRDETQFSRIMEPIRKTLGGAEQGARTVNELKQIRENLASPLYERAFAQNVQPTNKLKDLLGRPETQKAWRAVQRLGKSDPDVDVSQLGDDVLPSFRGWQAVTEQLSDRIGAFIKAGKGKSAGIIIRLRKQILDELDAQSPDYKQARELWAGTKQADDALEAGASFLKQTPQEVRETLKGMTDADKTFYRMGVGRAIEERLSTTTDTNDLSRLFRNQAFRQKAVAAFPSKAEAVDFINTVKAEAIKKTTTNLVGRGSQTRPREVVERQLGGAAINAESATLTGAAKKALSSVGRAREGTIQDIGELLLSQDPATQARALQMIERAQNNPLIRLSPTGAAAANVGGQRAR